jgi:hypothetical protein
MNALSKIDNRIDTQLHAQLIQKLKDVYLPPDFTSGSQLKFDNDHEPTRDPVLVKVVLADKCPHEEKECYKFQLVNEKFIDNKLK